MYILPKSLVARLNFSLASLLIVAGLLIAHLGLSFMDRELRQHTYSSLEQESSSLLAALINGLVDDEDDETSFTETEFLTEELLAEEIQPLDIDLANLPNDYLLPFSGKYFLLTLEEQTLRSPSLWDFNPDLSSSDQALQLISGPAGQQLLVFTGYYIYNDQPLTLSLASDYAPVLAKFNQLKSLSLALGAGVLFLVLLVQSWLIYLSLQPLKAARQELLLLEEGKLEELSSSQISELQPLIAQINQLLNHQNQQLNKSRSALGNLGHALKTPLAVAFSLANRAEIKALPEIHTNLTQQLNSLNARISKELARARLVSSGQVGVKFNPAEEVPKLVQLMQQVYGQQAAAKGLLLELSYQLEEELVLNYDRDDLLEMLGNLVDNACKWANSKVVIDIKKAKKSYLLTVDDDGEGLTEDQLTGITTAGKRLDEQVAGHGLGLSIVQEIVAAHQGQLTLTKSQLGGLRVVVKLPA